MMDRWREMLSGYVRKAAAAAALVGRRADVAPTACDVVYRSNKLRLLRYRRASVAAAAPPPPAPRSPAPLLFVPSLINRHYILDLMPGRSLVAFLVEQGHDVLMIDWGRPGGEDRYLTFDDYIDGSLHRCVRHAAACGAAGQVTLIGYCMGGTLAAIYAARHASRVRNLMSFAAPVDFADAGLLARWTDARYLDVDLLVDALGNVPWPLMQASFHLLVPTLLAQKALYLYDRLTDDEVVDHFLALETWGNDNVSFPGECFRRYIKELYQDNALVHDRLRIGGSTIRLADIRCPVLNVVAQGDHIVPAAAARLDELVGSADRQRWELPGGHIGAIVSRTATRTLWPRLHDWLAAH